MIMTLTLQEACMLHLYSLSPSAMLRFSSRWDIVSAVAFFQSLLGGRPEMKNAAEGHSAADVYEALSGYLNGDCYSSSGEDAGLHCRMDPALYEKVLYMATHGWQNEKGETYL
jgi:hypothetical protein